MEAYDRDAWYLVIFGDTSKVYKGVMAMFETSDENARSHFNEDHPDDVILDIVYCGSVPPVMVIGEEMKRSLNR